MKLLAFSDLHRDLGQAEKLVEMSADADVVIGAGDFASVHEGLAETIDALAAITTPTVLVPGNNETADALRAAVAASWPAATVLHGEATAIDGVEFFGLGAGVPTTPWEWSFDLTDDEAAALLAPCPEGAALILHSPPQGHCDSGGDGTHFGSPALLAAIEQKRPRLAVCGHIHESWGCESEVGSTPVRNLGPTGTWIEI
ncbi:MAG TPA: metallophosphoesterase family protein [Solirubrobacterales bacterium]